MYIRKLKVCPGFSNPKTIRWVPNIKYKYPPKKIDPLTWEIYAQEEIILKPREIKILFSGLGFSSSKGVVLISLDNRMIYKGCSIQNEVTFGVVPNISIFITNNSREPVKIEEKVPFCFVHYRV